jgi:MoaA/NifB/PqqE/SkfB family radical SAM enzyme
VPRPLPAVLRPRRFAVQRAARRARDGRLNAQRPHVPGRPAGAKLEMTYACNLRCGFCYTDSPRHTLARTPEMGDEQWAHVVDAVIESGVIETVVTGGEPFLRPEATLDAIERLAAAGVGVTLNTNGWFVDAALADRLAAVPGLHVHVSLDGASPWTHDRSRGLPGAWRRAVTAIDLLLERGAAAHAVHVVTPENESEVPDVLEACWELGVPSVRLSAVVPVGAAARSGRWAVDHVALERTVERFAAGPMGAMAILLQAESPASLVEPDRFPPAAYLVRPDGRVRIDSLRPFSFGHALDDGLEACWERIAAGWRSPAVERWHAGLRSTRELPDAGLVPYLDEEVEIEDAGAADVPRARRDPGARERALAQPVPAPAPLRGAPEDERAGVEQGRRFVRRLALARAFRLGPVRRTGDAHAAWLRRTDTGRIMRLNATGVTALGALAGGTIADGAGALARAHPGVAPDVLERDVLALARTLRDGGFLVPARAAGPVRIADEIPAPDLPVPA